MPLDIASSLVTTLLEIRSWTAHDLDSDGRVLAGHDKLGSSQLVLLDPDGTRTVLTALDRPCTGRFLPGRREVLVPLVRDPSFLHVLQDVTPTAVLYSTNRRNGVGLDLVRRDLDSGEEVVLWDPR